MTKSRVIAAALMSGVLVISGAASATVASADPGQGYDPALGWAPEAPGGMEAWPTCADAEAQFCIESTTINDQPATGSVSILPGPDGDGEAPWDSPQTINWAINSLASAGDAETPADLSHLSDVASITVRVGDFVPRYTDAYAKDFSLTTAESGGNHTLTVTGKPMHAWWNRNAETPCLLDACSGDMVATQEQVSFSGSTQNMSSWGDEAINMFSGTYVATNAQTFAPIVSFRSTPEDHWEYQVANPHFQIDGTTPATGSFEAFLPNAYFEAIDRTATDSDFVATRTDGLVTTSISGSTIREDGGARFIIPELTYSNPTLKVTAVPRSYAPGLPRSLNVVTAPTQVRAASWAAPLSNGGSAITGYRVLVERVTSGSGSSAVWGVVSNTVQTGLVKQFTPQFTSRYRVRVAAINAIGTSEYVSAEAPTAPTAPQNLAVVKAAADARVASWTVPVSVGSSPISGYRVLVERVTSGSGSSAVWGVVSNTVQTGRTKQFTPQFDSRYRVRVATINAVGSSAYAVDEAPMAPSVPRNLEVAKAPANGRVATWAVPQSLGSSPITGYRVIVERVTSQANRPVVWGELSDAVQTARTKRFVALTKSKYRVKVAAINADGVSDFVIAQTAGKP